MSFLTKPDRCRKFPFSGSVTAGATQVVGASGTNSYATLTVPGYTTDMIPLLWEIRNTTAPGGGNLHVRPGNGTGVAAFTPAAGAVLSDYDVLAPGVGYSEPKRHEPQEFMYSVASRNAMESLQVQASAGTVTFSGWVHVYEADV